MPDEPHKIAESRVTAQGEVSIPEEVRRRLGVGAHVKKRDMRR